MDITGLSAVSDLAGTVINKIWPDKTEAEKQQLFFILLIPIILKNANFLIDV